MPTLPHGNTESTYKVREELEYGSRPVYGCWRNDGNAVRWLEVRPLVAGGSRISVVRYRRR